MWVIRSRKDFIVYPQRDFSRVRRALSVWSTIQAELKALICRWSIVADARTFKAISCNQFAAASRSADAAAADCSDALTSRRDRALIADGLLIGLGAIGAVIAVRRSRAEH
jgi:hypothetical protein